MLLTQSRYHFSVSKALEKHNCICFGGNSQVQPILAHFTLWLGSGTHASLHTYSSTCIWMDVYIYCIYSTKAHIMLCTSKIYIRLTCKMYICKHCINSPNTRLHIRMLSIRKKIHTQWIVLYKDACRVFCILVKAVLFKVKPLTEALSY